MGIDGVTRSFSRENEINGTLEGPRRRMLLSRRATSARRRVRLASEGIHIHQRRGDPNELG